MYSLAYDICNVKFHATLKNFVELKDLFDHVLDRKFYLYGCTCSNCVVPVKDINLSRDPSTCSLKVIVEQIPNLKDETNSESNPPNENSKQETTPEQFPPSTDSVSQKKKKKNQKTKQQTEAKNNFKAVLTEIENKTIKPSQTDTCCSNKKSKANEINKNNDSNPIETEETPAATTSTEIKRSEKVEDTKETAILQKNDIHTLKSKEATSPIADFESSDDNELLSCNNSESEFSSPAFQKQPCAGTEKVEDANESIKPLKEAIGTITKSKSNDSQVLDIKSTDNSKVFCDDKDEVTPAEKHQQLDAGSKKVENSRKTLEVYADKVQTSTLQLDDHPTLAKSKENTSTTAVIESIDDDAQPSCSSSYKNKLKDLIISSLVANPPQISSQVIDCSKMQLKDEQKEKVKEKQCSLYEIQSIADKPVSKVSQNHYSIVTPYKLVRASQTKEEQQIDTLKDLILKNKQNSPQKSSEVPDCLTVSTSEKVSKEKYTLPELKSFTDKPSPSSTGENSYSIVTPYKIVRSSPTREKPKSNTLKELILSNCLQDHNPLKKISEITDCSELQPKDVQEKVPTKEKVVKISYTLQELKSLADNAASKAPPKRTNPEERLERFKMPSFMKTNLIDCSKPQSKAIQKESPLEDEQKKIPATKKVVKISYTLQELKSLADNPASKLLPKDTPKLKKVLKGIYDLQELKRLAKLPASKVLPSCLFKIHHSIIKPFQVVRKSFRKTPLDNNKTQSDSPAQPDLSTGECECLLNELIEMVNEKETPYELLDKWNSLSDSQHACILNYVLSTYIHSIDTNRQKIEVCLRLFGNLIRENVLSKQDFKKGFLIFSETWFETLNGWSRVFQFIGPLLFFQFITIENVWDEKWFNKTWGKKFLRSMIFYCISVDGTDYLRDFWKINSLRWDRFLPAESIEDFVTHNRLNHLQSRIPSMFTEISA